MCQLEDMQVFQAYAMYPQNRYLLKRARLFIEFIAQRFGESPYWDKDL